MNTGIQYRLTGERGRAIVHGYHHKPDPLKLSKSRHRFDVSGLKSKEVRNIIADSTGFTSRFTIGFEVEKTALHRASVREYELFCGFETDASCGYEAVSHILPLLPAGQWRTKVYDMFHKARYIIEDQYSPSDKRCGGHVTLGVEGLTGEEILTAVRPYCGIVLALFRYRLKNGFCGLNTNLRTASESRESWFNANDERMWASSRYQLALDKGNVLEFRVVSRYESVKQMMRRYELFYALLDFALNNKGRLSSFHKQIRPIVLSMYGGNEADANDIIEKAEHFQKFINTGIIHESIRKFLF